jgi:hemoglobin-like flavoprotein
MNIEVLERSFAWIKPHTTEFAASFYSNLFTDYPQVKPLFANSNMTEQGKHLMSALVLLIDNLHKPDVLTETLKRLGAKHLKYGTIREHYPMVGKSLLKTFKSYLGTDWTLEVEESWTDAYEAISNVMLEGTKDM